MKRFFAVLVFFCSAGALFAGELSVAAQVDKTEVALTEPLTFAVTIAGVLKETPKVELTSFDGFQVLATGQSNQIQLQQGGSRMTLTLTYTLAPTQPGVHTLGPVKVEYEGQVYETQPVEVRVLPGPAKPREPKKPTRPLPRLQGGTIL